MDWLYNLYLAALHAFNFALPALWFAAMAAVLVSTAQRSTKLDRLLRSPWRVSGKLPAWRRAALWHGWVSLAVMFAGLLWFGRDGKMWAYALLCAANALLWVRGPKT